MTDTVVTFIGRVRLLEEEIKRVDDDPTEIDDIGTRKSVDDCELQALRNRIGHTGVTVVEITEIN